MVLTANSPKSVNRKTGQVLPPRLRCNGMRVIQERNHGHTPTVAYTRGTDLSGSLEGAGGIGGLLARSHGGGWSTHNYYHADGNGNVTYLVNSSQGLAASYRYDPYGNTISSSGTLASANVYRFSSKEIHVNSGLYYYGYRWYAPNLQRWVNRDPIEEQSVFQRVAKAHGGQFAAAKRLEALDNLYSFNYNNPLRYVDSDGRFVIVIPGIIIGAGQAGTVLYGICMAIPSCREALAKKIEKAIEKCKPNTPPKNDDDCEEMHMNCILDPWQPPSNPDYGKRKDCLSCLWQCRRTGRWPTEKCP